jgi:arabinose-5-phosphate isomerase
MTIDARDSHLAMSDITSGQRVLATEAEALRALGQSLGTDFARAVQVLAAVSGRVIVSGMGKSGHVGRKIAATLASTGCPAFFVHPAEASHGDLGMVTPGDVVVALSNSGETPELSDIIAYTRRFDIPLVGLTSRAGSLLAEASTVALILPAMAEACPMGLAPTTSTTMMLALGDALAVALLERRNFSPADFKVFHPGGQLGQRLLKVGDLMHRGDALPLVGMDTLMSEVLLAITAKSFGCAGVLAADGHLAGIITDGDLRRHIRSDLLALRACEVMTADPKTVHPNLLAAEAVHIMNAKSITSLFVVAEGGPAGLLHIHDCLRAGVA